MYNISFLNVDGGGSLDGVTSNYSMASASKSLVIPQMTLNGRKTHVVVVPENEVGRKVEVNDLLFDYAGANLGGRKEEFLGGLEQSLKGVETVKKHNDWYRDSGKYNTLKRNAARKGWGRFNENIAYASNPGLSNPRTGSLAFTSSIMKEYTLLGAGSNLEMYAKSMSVRTGINSEFFIEDALVEEYLHNVQPNWVHSLAMSRGMVELMEAHVRNWKSLHFFEMGESTGEEGYKFLSKENYNEYIGLLKRHIKLFGVEVSDSELEELLEQSPEKVIKTLAEKSTKSPSTKEKRYAPDEKNSCAEEGESGESEEGESEE